jgi:hypothetical protein
MKVRIQIDGEERAYPVTLNMTEEILTLIEEGGYVKLILEISRISPEEIEEKLPSFFQGFKGFFGLTKKLFSILTHGEVDAGDMEVDVAMSLAMQVLTQIVSPLRYVLSKDHLEGLKKNISESVTGAEQNGKNTSPNDGPADSLKLSSTS